MDRPPIRGAGTQPWPSSAQGRAGHFSQKSRDQSSPIRAPETISWAIPTLSKEGLKRGATRKKPPRQLPHTFDCINNLFLFTASYMHIKRNRRMFRTENYSSRNGNRNQETPSQHHDRESVKRIRLKPNRPPCVYEKQFQKLTWGGQLPLCETHSFSKGQEI